MLLLTNPIKSIDLNSCKNFNTQPLQAKHVLNILAQNFATNIQSQQRIYIIDVIDPKNLAVKPLMHSAPNPKT